MRVLIFGDARDRGAGLPLASGAEKHHLVRRQIAKLLLVEQAPGIVQHAAGAGGLNCIAHGTAGYHHFPAWFETIFHSGISSAAIMAILLNLAFNHFKAGNSDQQSVFVAGHERTLRYQDIAALNDGDYFKGGKLFDVEGK